MEILKTLAKSTYYLLLHNPFIKNDSQMGRGQKITKNLNTWFMDGPYVHMMKSKHLILFSICSPSIHLRGYKNTIRKLKMKPFTATLLAPSTTFHNSVGDFMEAANGSI